MNALGQLFVVLEILLPLAIGALAAHAGLAIALAALSLQPLAIALVAWSYARARQ